MPGPSAAYTTPVRLRVQLSADGVDLRTDDPVTDALLARIDLAQTMCLNATYEVYFFVGPRYSDAALLLSQWVGLKTTRVAVHMLCMRRNEPVPPAVKEEYERALEQLEQVRLGKADVADAGQRKAAVPVLSRPVYRGWPVPHVAVERRGGTGSPEGYRTWYDPTEWFDPAWGGVLGGR